MARGKYAIVRTDNIAGTDARSGLVSVKYMGADGATPTEIQNGSVVKLDKLIDAGREIYIGKDVTATDSIKEVVLVATPELMYDERKKNLDEFINEAGSVARGYHFHAGGEFSATKEAFDCEVDPKVGNIVELANGTKLKVVDSATDGSTIVGFIIAVEKVSSGTYYVVRISDNSAGAPAATKPEPVQYKVPDQSDTTLGDKKISELIGDDINIAADGKVTGTIHYINDFTAFNQGNAGEQKGNFFPISFTCEGEQMVIKRDGSVRKTVAFDKDLIIRVQEQTSVYEVEVDSKPIVKLDFSTATLEKAKV